MPQEKKSKPKKTGIPPEALEHLLGEIEGMGIEELEGVVHGRFCYVYYESEPLCRLGYRGTKMEWDFAIFRYTRGNYGELPLASTRGQVADMIDLALHAYGIL